jgi:hypothetical protein
VERSHRTDREEFYRPYLKKIPDAETLFEMAALWVFYYNVSRPHMGGGMAGHPPLGVLQAHGFSGAERIALFPPLLLDPIADALLLACDPEGGNNLLAHYKLWFHRGKEPGSEKISSSPRMRAARWVWANLLGLVMSSVGDSSLGVRTCRAFLDREGRPLREAWRGCGPPCPRVRVRSPEANFGRPLARAL